MFCFFGYEACEILAPRPGIEPTASALKVEVLTTGLPGKSLEMLFSNAHQRDTSCVPIGLAASICSVRRRRCKHFTLLT